MKFYETLKKADKLSHLIPPPLCPPRLSGSCWRASRPPDKGEKVYPPSPGGRDLSF